jgi:CheY-like chemotaxis protein
MRRPLILIVDDDAPYREILAEVLNETYKVVTAGTARDGIQEAQELHPRVILMDVTLPDLSGLEALKQLKLDAGTSDIPVVMLTGHLIELANHPLAAAVLLKPIRTETLLATLERVRKSA